MIDVPVIPPGHVSPGLASSVAASMPSAVFSTGEEFLRVRSFGSAAGVTLSLTGRVLRPDATPTPIQETHTPASNRTLVTTLHPISEGWLLGLEVLATGGAPGNNTVWVSVELVRGGGANAQALQSLVFGYVTARTPASWPGGINAGPLEGAGALRAIVGTLPGAGAEISETVPAAARWELLSFRAPLVTSATVTGRIAQFTLDDGANIYGAFAATDATPATTTAAYTFAQGTIQPRPPGGFNNDVPAPVNIRLAAGHRIRTVTINLQAGDQYGAPNYLVREWLDV